MVNLLSVFKTHLALPALSDFKLEKQDLSFSLDKLTTGVDNLRYDVLLSPKISKAAADIAYHFLAEYSGLEEILGIDRSSNMNEREKFKTICCEILLDGIARARSERQIQIDFLAQIAIAKMLISTIQSQFDVLAQRFKSVIWINETSQGLHHSTTLKLREKLSDIQRNKKLIIYKTGVNLFKFYTQIQQKNLQEVREANFGFDILLPNAIFSNPMIHSKDIVEADFVMEEYGLLLGQRKEDLDSYDNLLSLVRNLFGDIGSNRRNREDLTAFQDSTSEDQIDIPGINSPSTYIRELNSIIICPENMDILLNYFESKSRYKRLKKQKVPKEVRLSHKKTAKIQKKLLTLFYSHFDKAGMIKRIVSLDEAKPFFAQYCPPLVPYQVLQFLLEPKTRRSIINRYDRLKKFYHKSVSTKPLRKLIKKLDKISTIEKERRLIAYLKRFSLYTRDFLSHNIIKVGMEKVNLISDEKMINLSRANNCLYEFLIPLEMVVEEKPILNHVIIKADVRGSTDITDQMKGMGLNPASFLSLNFFDPISQILSEYGAVKVFIEGDAIILAIFDYGNSDGGWYNVARACGLAINMLSIISRYNINSKKNGLPVLELGIGITYREGPPTFLFDGNKRIMISPAINLADRLSGCSKSVRQLLSGSKKPFNLYVYQSAPEGQAGEMAEDLMLRYNVNGIELDTAGFKMLSKEIYLKPFNLSFPDIQEENIRIYAGKFPTTSGQYENLIIREAPIPEVTRENLNIKSFTDRTYYEVCTLPKLYKHLNPEKTVVASGAAESL